MPPPSHPLSVLELTCTEVPMHVAPRFCWSCCCWWCCGCRCWSCSHTPGCRATCCSTCMPHPSRSHAPCPRPTVLSTMRSSRRPASPCPAGSCRVRTCEQQNARTDVKHRRQTRARAEWNAFSGAERLSGHCIDVCITYLIRHHGHQLIPHTSTPSRTMQSH